MNTRWMIGGLFLVVLGVTRPTLADPVESSAERGRIIYARVGCYLCHGYQGQGGAVRGTPGGAGPKIAQDPLPLEAFRQFVRSTQTMPAYSAKVLPDADVAAIYAYLHSIAPSPPVEAIPALRDLGRTSEARQ